MRQALFISGRGSNLKAFLDESAGLNTQFVFSNKLCPGLKWAKKRGVYSEIKSLKNEKDWTDFAEQLNFLKIKYIYLLGFMKIIPKKFLDMLDAKVVNIHPSVLPDYPGLNSLEKTFLDKKAMGCTLHHVVPEVDSGEIIFQKKIKQVKGSSLTDFSYRIHNFEQALVTKFARMVN